MAEMGAGSIASAGPGLFQGTAASMTMYPVVSLPVQAYRFTAVTWKMLEIIGRTHQH